MGIASPLPRTHLSLFRWAQIHGLNPLHIAGGTNPPLFPPGGSCTAVWSRHLWQQPDQESWESILLAIQDAESTVRGYLGYQAGPWWVSGRKVNAFKSYDNHFTNSINISSQNAGINLNEGHIIAPGRRAVTLIAEAADVVYTDENGDGFDETATITVTAYTEEYDWREIKVYIDGKDGDPRWEIRHLRSVEVDTVAETLTIVLDSWLLIEPDVQARFPTIEGLEGLDMTDADNYVLTVDVYREYNDFSQSGAQLIWEKRPANGMILAGPGQDEATNTTQDGTLIVRNDGLVAPVPAAYDVDEAHWTVSSATVSRNPDMYKLWYYSGFVSEEWSAGYTSDPLDSNIATAIAYLSAARLPRGVCQCGEERIKYLREPNGFVSPAGNFLAVSDTLQECPFGTRRGEWLAYNMLSSPNVTRHIKVAVF